MAVVPDGTGSRGKVICWCTFRISFCSVGGSRLKLSEVGWRIDVSGFVVQMYTALIATFERDRFFWHMRETNPKKLFIKIRFPVRYSNLISIFAVPSLILVLMVPQIDVYVLYANSIIYKLSFLKIYKLQIWPNLSQICSPRIVFFVKVWQSLCVYVRTW